MYGYPVSPAEFVKWANAQQKTFAFWQRAASSYVSASLLMMQNFNQMVTASMPMVEKALELGEAVLPDRPSQPAQTAATPATGASYGRLADHQG